MKTWQLQDAKARLSELVRDAQSAGPQEITIHGKTTAVLLSKADYERLASEKQSLLQFLRDSPMAGVELQIDRDRAGSKRRIRL